MSKSLRSFATVFVVLYGAFVVFALQETKPAVVFETPPEVESHSDLIATQDEDLPASVRISVPFTSQAPYANWDDPYQEACEEAALVMAHAYLENTPLSQEEADKQIRDLIRWEEEHGYPEDIGVEDLAEIARAYYGYDASILSNPKVEDLKQLLAQGIPIIVPAAGRELKNPYFSGEGPWYHMLLLTGYDRHFFITNDPGTKRGEGYKYSEETILRSMHNWTGVKEETHMGEAKVLTLTKAQ